MTGGSKYIHFKLPQSKIRDFCQLPQNEGAKGGFTASHNERCDKSQFVTHKTAGPRCGDRRCKFVGDSILEVTLQQALETTAVASLITN